MERHDQTDATISPIQVFDQSTSHYETVDIRFWAVWRVLEFIALGVLGGSLLGVLSIISVTLPPNWSVFTVGITSLTLMSIISFVYCVGIVIIVYSYFFRQKREEQNKEQFWVLMLLLISWIQPYLNPISLGIRWSEIFPIKANESETQGILAYSISQARISGFCSSRF